MKLNKAIRIMGMKKWFLSAALFEVCVLVLLLLIIATAHQTYRKAYSVENKVDSIGIKMDSIDNEIKTLNDYLYD